MCVCEVFMFILNRNMDLRLKKKKPFPTTEADGAEGGGLLCVGPRLMITGKLRWEESISKGSVEKKAGQ